MVLNYFFVLYLLLYVLFLLKNYLKMNQLPFTKTFYFSLIFMFFVTSVTKIFAQNNRNYVQQDPKIAELLAEKRKINASITLNDRYKIQIYYGTAELCKKELVAFKKVFKEVDGTIVYSNPTYKVLVGNFKTRIEAEKTYLEIKKKYPSALLIKPKK